MKLSNYFLLVVLLAILGINQGFAQAPVNDNCQNATVIPISGNGYDIGTFVSLPSDLTSATIQSGEYFDSSIPLTLQSGSVWYSFSLPTARGCDLLVEEPTGIDNFSSAFAGFALYRSNTCFPGFDEIQDARLVPQGALGHSVNPCLLPGNYLLQVVCNQAFNGPIAVTLTLTEPSPAPYDFQTNAGDLGVLTNCASSLVFNAGCLTIDDNNEFYPGLGTDSSEYTQSAWFTFTTPAAFDELAINFVPTASYVYSTTETAFAYNLYQGDVHAVDYTTLTEVDSEIYNLYSVYALHPGFSYRCGELLPNTTYSLRFIMHHTVDEDLQVVVHAWGGTPTVAPTPLNVPAPNALGALADGVTNASDWFACNARMELNDCGTPNPDTGIWIGASLYNLSDWFTFELTTTSNITVSGNCWSPAYNDVYLRLFSDVATASCGDLNYPSDRVIEGHNSITKYCLLPGTYSVQVLGRSYDELGLWYWDACNYFSDGQLGRPLNISINVVSTVDINQFALQNAGDFDPINNMNDLPVGVPITSQVDVFGCANTLMPDTTICDNDYYNSWDPNRKAMYRQFTIGDGDLDLQPDSGIITIVSGNEYAYNYRLYRGNANSLATSQGVQAAGEWISGLEPVSECMYHGNNDYCCNGYDYQVCVTPGEYTLVTFGDSTDIALSDQVTVQFDLVTNLFDSPSEAEVLGDIWLATGAAGGTVTSTTDHFGCHDNAIDLNGSAPCGTKAIYREFYLSEASLVSISTNPLGCWWGCAYAPFTVFEGRVSQDIAGLNPLWSCVANANTGPCIPLDAGWYSVVSYIDGPTYEDPLSNSLGTTGNGIGMPNIIYINVTPPGQLSQYNRPHKACNTLNNGDPAVITWGPNEGDNQWESTDNMYYLCTEYFGCSNDTPWVSHPIVPCNTGHTKVAYYVFTTTQNSYLAINTGNFESQLFNFDVRIDSLLLPTTTAIQPCAYGMQFCDLPAGTYTLVIWASDANYGQTVTPEIFIDRVGYSRFDFAQNAYDFGLINPDNTWYDGKVGDVNPIDPSRAPSNDHFFCTTGAFDTDPAEMSCWTGVNNDVYTDSVYNNMFDGPSYAIRRNIWYTFTVDGAGTCSVYIEPKPGKNVQRYAIYRSDVNGSLPFAAVQMSGQVDSTLTDGLSFVAGNLYSWWCYAYNEVSFYRDPCEPQEPTRYYVVVEHNAALDALNSQCELRIKWDPLVETPVLYDHYSQANCINGLNQSAPPYTNVALGAGSYSGEMDNFVCASADATDPYLYYCQPRTLWYYVDVNVSGYLKFRGQFFDINDNPLGSGTEVIMYRQAFAGDSSTVVWEPVNATSVWSADGYWNQACVYEGRYYLIFPGCSYLLHKVYPEIEISEQVGDFCDNPIVTGINGIGSSTASVVVDCHTIGEDFGESGNNMGCLLPSGANVNNYKSSWFRIDITGSTSVDFTFQLNAALTNIDPSFIRYRILLGSCDAMNVGSCFSNSQTINTINCLAPGSYYLQVVTPEYYPWGGLVTGSVGFTFTTTPPADPNCMPQNTCYAITSFSYVDDCANAATQFLSQSTAGDLVDILWQFGYNNQTSSEENPIFQYPILDVVATYTVILTVTNLECGETAADTALVTIQPKPQFDLPDTLQLCNGNGIVLDPNPSLGTQIYWPQTGSTDDTIFWSSPGWNEVYVQGTIDACTRVDTAMIYMSPLSNANLGPDRILCSNDSVYIDAVQGYGEHYLWSDGDTISTNYLLQGQHVIEWFFDGCVISDTLLVSLAQAASPLGPDTTVCFGTAGYTLDASTGSAYNYVWQNGSTGQIYTVSSEGLYWVDIYTPECIIRDSVVINEFLLPPPVFTGDTVFCEGQSVTLSGPDNYSYLWGDTSTGQSLTITSPGIMWLQIADTNDCVASSWINILQLPMPDPAIFGDVTLCGNDSIYLLTQVGFDQYAWSTGSTTTNTWVNSLGWVYIEVVDQNGCTGIDSVEVVSGVGGALQFTGNMEFCEGDSTLISTTQSYISYLWPDGSTNSYYYADQSESIQLTVTDNNGCAITADTSAVALPTPMIQILSDGSICSGGNALLVADHDPGTITWSGNGINGLMSDSVIISMPGIYEVTLTTANGCSNTSSVNVSEVVLVPSITGTLGFCAGQSTTISGQSGYTYLWSDGSTNQDLVVNTPGFYTIEVSDALGCTGDATVEVIAWPLPSFTILGNLIFCENGFTELTVDQSFSAYSWSTGSDSINTSVDVIGMIYVTVNDANNCAATDSVFVNSIPSPSPQFVGNLEFCEGDSTVIGLDMIFDTYQWHDGSTDSIFVVTASSLIEVVVTNSLGCYYALDTLLSAISAPTIDLITDSLVCNGGQETITLIHSGTGVNWFADANSTFFQDSIVVYQPQTVSVEVIDNNGCMSTAEIDVLLENITAQIMGDTTFCAGSSTMLWVEPTFVDFDWSSGEISSTIAVSSPANVTVNVIDANGCIASASSSVFEMPLPQVEIVGDTTLCPGGNVILEVIGVYNSVSWSNNTTGNSTVVENPGTIEVFVESVDECLNSDIIEVVLASPLTPSIIGNNVICQGEILTLESDLNYDVYLWSNGVETQTVDILLPGTYSLQVWDTEGCTGMTQADVVFHPAVEPQIDGLLSHCEGEQATYTVVNQYPYLLWNQAILSDTLYTALGGEINVEVHDLNGCVGFDTIQVSVHLSPNPIILGEADPCVGDTIYYSTSTLFPSMIWNNQINANGIFITESSLITLEVIDSNGCSADASLDVEFHEVIPPLWPDSLSFCEGDVLTLDAGPNYYAYSWSNGETSSSIEVTASGNANVEVFDEYGCSAHSEMMAIMLIAPSPELTGVLEICAGDSSVISTQGGFETYLWNDGSQIETYVASSSEWINVTVSSINGCFGSDSVYVEVHENPTPIVQGISPACDGESITLSLDQLYSQILWNTGEITQSIQVLTSGIYDVIVEDENGCIGEAIHEQDFISPTEIQISGPSEFCVGDTIYLNGPSGFTNYIWNGQSGASTYEVTVDTNVTLEVLDDYGCASSDIHSLEIHPLPLPTIMGELTFCENASTELSVGSFVNYLWSTGATTNQIVVDTAGVYSVEVIDANGCSNQSDTSVTMNYLPSPVFLAHQTLCYEESPTIEYYSTDTFQWSNGDTSLIYPMTASGMYEFSVANACGVVDFEIEIEVIDCDWHLYIPNTFTPDNDGINDTWKPVTYNIASYHLRVFDRWGIVVFESKDLNEHWTGNILDGAYYGMNDAYNYVISYTTHTGEVFQEKGSVIMLR
ncbi:MAG: hypothetical protein RLZZ262_2527 [Bacteroidota bacterium]